MTFDSDFYASIFTGLFLAWAFGVACGHWVWMGVRRFLNEIVSPAG